MRLSRKLCRPLALVLSLALLAAGAFVLPAPRLAAAQVQTPTVTGISPAQGGMGGGYFMTISGSNFATESEGQVEVTIGGVVANVVYRSATELQVEVPPRDPMPTQPVPVAVTNVIAGQRYTAANQPLFTYKPGPVIDYIAPNYGSTAGGGLTVITGKNFALAGYPNVEVKFGDGNEARTATIVEKQDTVLKVYHPAGIYTGSPVAVTVRVYDGSNTLEARLPDAFFYTTDPSNPKISAVSPNVIAGTGGEVTVYGQDFRTALAGDGTPVFAAVYLESGSNSYAAEVRRLTTNAISVRVPSLPPGIYGVRVINPDGKQAGLAAALTVTPSEQALRILSITPNKGSVEGGLTVTLKVVNLPQSTTDFPRVAVVKFGDVPARDEDVSIVDENTVTAKTPGGMREGVYNVALEVTYKENDQIKQQVAALPQGFEFVIPTSNPQISAVNPAFGPVAGGTVVTITGSDFRSPAVGEAVYVYFGRELATNVQVVSSTQITAVTPSAAVPGAVDVEVINPDGARAVLPGGFVYLSSPPYITSVTPNSGTAGTEVVIAAANLAYREEDKALVRAEMGEIVQDEQGNLVERFDAMQNVSLVELGGGAWLVRATVPPLAPGPKLVRVRTAYGVSNALSFTYVPAAYPAPVVQAVYPTQGPASGGTAITIEGENFQTGAKVYLGGRELSSTVVRSVYEITGTTPVGLLPGMKYPLRVVNPDGREGSLPDAFYVYSEPRIDQVLPVSGSVYGGNIITVRGAEFYPGARVVLQGQTVHGEVYAEATEVEVLGQDELRFRLPRAQGPGGDITLSPGEEVKVDLVIVNSDGGTANLTQGFTYRRPYADPVISSVVPEWGPVSGGVEINISGNGFFPGAKVFLGWEEARVVQVSPTSIRAVIPAQPEGKYKVTVVNDLDGGAAVWSELFEYRQPRTSPRITGVFPDKGPNYQPTLVTVRGENFWPGAQVFFGTSVAQEVYFLDTTTLKVYTPITDLLGPVDVRLVDPYGGTFVLRNGFTFTRPAAGFLPVIDRLSPAEGSTQGGTKVVIEGRNFFEGAKVYFDGFPSPAVQVLGTDRVVAETPPHPPGSVEVTLVNWDGGAATYYSFTYRQPGTPPEIRSLEPAVGRAMEETPVVISGRNFQPGAKVYFGYTEVETAKVQVKDYYTIEAVAPPLPVGKVDVRVVNPDFGEAILRGGFTYQGSVPKINAVNPSQGRKEGGYAVTILGEDFRPGSPGGPRLRVFFGAQEVQAADITYVDAGTVLVKVPASDRVGPVDVRLVNPDGAEAVRKDGFLYTSPASSPRLDSVTPDKGPTSGGLWVMVKGNDLREEARVYFGAREAAQVRFLDNNALLALLPPQPAGQVAVTVVNYDGGSATKENAFTYVTPGSSPRIDAVEPNRGPHVGGTAITIRGLDFRSGAAVYIDGVPARNVQVKSYKEITAETPPGTPGPRDVTVVNPDQGAFTARGAFTYFEAKVPKIARIEPDRGPKDGGTPIAVTGGGFAAGARLFIGGREAVNVKVVSAERLEATTPPGQAGWQEVKVVNPDGGFTTLARGFLYLAPPGSPGWLAAAGVDDRTIRLDWSPVEFATHYEIFVAESPAGPFAFLDQTTATRYYATGLLPDRDYFFKVRALNDLGVSLLSDLAWSATEEGEEAGATGGLRQETSGDTLYLRLYGADAWRQIEPTLDLVTGRYAGVRVVEIRAGVAEAMQAARSLTIRGSWFRLQLPAGIFSVTEARRLGEAERREAVFVLKVEEVPPSQARELVRGLAGRVVSRLLRVDFALEVAGQRRAIGSFGASPTLNFVLDPRLAGAGRAVIYHYGASGTWTPLGGIVTWDRFFPGALVSAPGVFALVAVP